MLMLARKLLIAGIEKMAACFRYMLFFVLLLAKIIKFALIVCHFVCCAVKKKRGMQVLCLSSVMTFYFWVSN